MLICPAFRLFAQGDPSRGGHTRQDRKSELFVTSAKPGVGGRSRSV